MTKTTILYLTTGEMREFCNTVPLQTERNATYVTRRFLLLSRNENTRTFSSRILRCRTRSQKKKPIRQTTKTLPILNTTITFIAPINLTNVE
jgi:hypothetical protein